MKTVGELRDELDRWPDDMPLRIIYPSNDYWGTDKAGEVHFVDRVTVKHSDYHSMDVVTDSDKAEDEDVETKDVLGISMMHL